MARLERDRLDSAGLLEDLSLRILFVEDSEEDAELVGESLRDAGCVLESGRVETTEELSRALAEQTWDVILSDFDLPNFDGSRTIELVRERGLDIPVVMVSGTLGEERAVEMLKAGASDYVMKSALARLPHSVARALREVEEQRQLKQAEQLRRESEERYRSVVETSLDGIVTTDMLGITTFANHRLADMLGLDASAELIGRPNMDMIAAEDQDLVTIKMREVTERAAVTNVRCRLTRSDGSTFTAELSAVLLRDGSGAPSGITATIRDVTDRVAYETGLQDLALHDPLTGLANRTLVHDRLEQALVNRLTIDAPVSVLVIDLDEFKAVNDTFGHHLGDEVLKEVGRRIQRQLRKSDTVGRVGGDEFQVVLPGANTTQALRLAGNIVNSLCDPIVLEDHDIRQNASIGIANRPEHSGELASLMRFADIAMYRAKLEESACAIYSASGDAGTAKHFVLARDLRHAIENGDLLLHYQPQVDVRSSQVRWVEALVRWQHATRGLIPPIQFIELAERAGLMKQLTAWVVGEAARQSVEWRAGGLELAIAVNLSAENLHDPDLLAMIQQSIDSVGANPAWFGMEITETSIMRQPDHALKVIQSLNTLGMRIAIDDFGTGYSSLGYLKRFAAHVLKIDRSFVLDMSENNNEAIIVSAIIDLGHKLGLQVVAEGVEDQVMLDRLVAAGCDTIQGYYLSRPLTKDAVEEWFRNPPPQATQMNGVHCTAAT